MYQMREERKEGQRLVAMAWREARASNNLEKLTKALCEMELQDDEVPDDDHDEHGDSKMTEAEMAESEKAIDSYLNQMFTNFECGTWYLNRWLASNNDPHNIKRDNLNFSHTVMCNCISNKINHHLRVGT